MKIFFNHIPLQAVENKRSVVITGNNYKGGKVVTRLSKDDFQYLIQTNKVQIVPASLA